MSLHLTFLGASGTVTGSKYLLESPERRVLLDCGLFQGLKALRLRNWAEPTFNPQSLDAVVLSHAHLDHAGYLPLLARRGFRGPVFCTPGTAELLPVMLEDSARLQEGDAERANRYGYTRHTPAKPLYTVEDVRALLELVRPRPYHRSFEVTRNVHAVFRRTGHILGSASIELNFSRPQERKVVFSGDLGRWNRPILRDPELVEAADYLLVESTYGDRVHGDNGLAQLERVITETAQRGGTVVVPAFAVGRTQELLWSIRKLQDDQRLPPIDVYVDSPMAINVSEIYSRHPEDHDLDMQALTDAQRSPLSPQQYNLVRTTEESKALGKQPGPMVIIASSGMATGGRVLHHLAQRLGDARNTVLLTGFQAAGTRGRSLQQGAKTIRIHGSDVPVKAQVQTIDGLSAHADCNDLLRWMRGIKKPPIHTYIVHGESDAAEALAASVRTELGWSVSVAQDGHRVSLSPT